MPAEQGAGEVTKPLLTRLKMLWFAARDSLWFIPALLTLMAAVSAIVLVRIETDHDIPPLGKYDLLFRGSVDGAREVLSTIAGSLITVTGVVFSVTIVALQLASTQYTPRILRNFMADRSNQLVLGVFIATFTYTLLVLRVLRSDREGEPFVPPLSVSLAIGLCLISIAFLIFFIHHAARSIQAAVILDGITRGALDQVQRLFPAEIGQPEDPSSPALRPAEWNIERSIVATNEGYLQAVDGTLLFRIGEEQQLLIEMALPIGEFVLAGMALAKVWSKQPLEDATERRIRQAFLVGAERTPDQDLDYFFLEISDMAVKALSPGINDPTTANHCIDRLTQILLALGKRRPPAALRTENGQMHFVAFPPDFLKSVRVAFAEIVHYGKSNPAIIAKLARSLHLLRSLLPQEHCQSIADFCESSGVPGPPSDRH